MRNTTFWLVTLVTCSACGSNFTAAATLGGSAGTVGLGSGGSSTSLGGASGTTAGNPGASGGTSTTSGGSAGSGSTVNSGGEPGAGSSGGSSAATGSGDSGGAATGGTQDTGGGSGSNTGGASGGSAGSGGVAGSAGGSGSLCDSLKTTYLSDLAKARLCDQGSLKQCSKESTLPDACGCPVLVNALSTSTAQAKVDQQSLQEANCTFAPCGVPCAVIFTASCSQEAHTMTFMCQ